MYVTHNFWVNHWLSTPIDAYSLGVTIQLDSFFALKIYFCFMERYSTKKTRLYILFLLNMYKAFVYLSRLVKCQALSSKNLPEAYIDIIWNTCLRLNSWFLDSVTRPILFNVALVTCCLLRLNKHYRRRLFLQIGKYSCEFLPRHSTGFSGII